MKKIILALLLALAGTYHCAAQSDTVIYLYIDDANVLESVQQNQDSTVTPVFTDQGINDIISNYTFYVFQTAYPSSRLPYMHRFYKVIVSSTAVAAELKENFPLIFPYFEIQAPAVPCADYYPNDFSDNAHSCGSCSWLTYTWYLSYIHAPKAWGVTHGDPSVVIGITDTWLDVTNPDFAGKMAHVGTNVFPGDTDPYVAHGTQVAGLVAGATDNWYSYASVGFNCRFDFSSDYGNDNEMLNMSASPYRRRILNGSWRNGAAGTLDPDAHIASQTIYNEIYENGTIAVFAAGNGMGGLSPIPPDIYCFPASLDHNISVTNVMGEHCPWTGTVVTACDEHNKNTGDTVNAYQHNPRVDICAPAVRVGGTTYNPGWATSIDDHYFCDACGWGTSFASPIVAGSLGLMLSANPCLSPYQLEYALKMGARDIYGVADNAYVVNERRLGFGALDVGASVAGNGTTFNGIDPSNPLGLNCNDAATQTFFIKGIEINTLCAPGLATNSISPVLTPIVENGTPTYTYRWDPLPGNSTTLSSRTAANPTIATSFGTHLAFYRLTVYDASPVQKVASQTIKVQLQTSVSYTLGMRDSYLDMLDQPNSQTTVDPRETQIWQSPDVWNRLTNDGGTTPQNVEYFMSAAPNYMYVRVRNVGCADYTTSQGAEIYAYWTLASTGEHWPVDWTTAVVPGVIFGTTEPGGAEVTLSPVSIPLLHPGDVFVTAIPWYPVDPLLYDGSPTSIDVCALARIEEPVKANLGMFATEVTYTTDNVRNNKNIVTHNMSLVNLGHRHAPFNIRHIHVGNAGASSGIFSLHMSTDRDTYKHFAGNISEFLYVKVKMEPGLFAAWQNGGGLGTYASVDMNDYSVIYDPATPLRLDSITLDSGAKYSVEISFILRDMPINIPASQQFHFRQLVSNGESEEIYGNVSFSVHVEPDVPKGVLAVTEISNGPSGNCEYAEMIVANCGNGTSQNVNISGWILDDNAGVFNKNGCGITNISANIGHYRLPHNDIWEEVPVGSMIVLYNHDDNCYNLAGEFRVDTTETGIVYWLPVGGTAAEPYGTPHVERYYTLPRPLNCNYCNDSTLPYHTASAWTNTIGLDNAGDGFQVRCPGCDSINAGTPSFYHGIGYGPATGLIQYKSVAAGAGDLGGPVKSGSGAASKYVFTGSTAADLGNPASWTKSAADAAGSVPSTLGNVNTTLMGAVTSHKLSLPCCGSGVAARSSDPSAGPVIGEVENPQNIQDISVYPNPANTMLYFQFPVSGETHIRLMDISGRVMNEQVVINNTTASIDLKGYVPGLYLYQVITDGKTQSGKVLIEK